MERRVAAIGLAAVLVACGSERDRADASLPDGSDSCVADDECMLGVDHTDCCGCSTGYTVGRVAADACITPIGEAAPAGCARDPSCAGTMCRCAPAVRVACQAGACVALETCAADEVLSGGRCMPACATDADCVLAADYGSCCGGCSPFHVAIVEKDPCLASSAVESSCSPAPGACDGLGCPSPPLDCGAAGGTVVCMADGICAMGP